MARFWPTAARILKPGGTVALWCSKFSKAHRKYLLFILNKNFSHFTHSHLFCSKRCSL